MRPSGRVLRVARDAGEREPPAIHPAGVPIRAPQEQRPIRHDGIERLAVRAKSGAVDFADHEPALLRILRQALADDLARRFDGELLVLETASSQPERTFGRMNVTVDEARQHGHALGPQHFRLWADLRRGPGIIANVRDFPARTVNAVACAGAASMV